MERKKKAYNTIKQLVQRFSEYIDEYKRGNYATTLTPKRGQIQRAIDHAERKIEEIVYEF